MSGLVTKKVLVFVLVTIMLMTVLSMTAHVSAAPPTTGPGVPTLPYYCEISNAGIEACDNKDNDCDTFIDEGVSKATTCGVGICEGNTGVIYCSLGGWTGDTCNPLARSTVETCNGLDDDCDGTVDEGCICTNNDIRRCGTDVGECIAGTNTCVNGNWSSTCVGEVKPVTETCDNKDNDCDGFIDDAVTRPTTCGVGICTGNNGTERCISGEWGGDTCDRFARSTAEVCNNLYLDEDCDGVVNEGCVCVNDATMPCGSDVGACVAGVKKCVSGTWGTTCIGEVTNQTEVCNALDDDCDGFINDGLPNKNLSTPCSTGLFGICSAGTNYMFCNSNVTAYTWTTCVQNNAPQTEVCDALDNDCDGVVNEDLPFQNLNSNCSTGKLGICSTGTRYQYCNANVNSYNWTSCSQTNNPVAEICNALDDDCDGVINNGLPNKNLSTSCTTGLFGVCSAGTKYMYCNSGVSSYDWSSCSQNVQSSNEICDGLDNDCDSFTDEGCSCVNGDTQPCGSDIGACKTGVQTCVSGSWGSTCVGEIKPTTEVCDNLDNDCDGVINNGLPNQNMNTICTTDLFGVCSAGTKYMYCNASVSSYNWTTCSQTVSASTEVCDALDNDCDGVINDGLPNQNLSSDCTTGMSGVCSAGTKYMYCNANVNTYTWNSCINKINSSVETCNGVDDDCDGTTDEDCACLNGANQTCGSDVGVCKKGIQTCVNGAWSAACVGEIISQPEVCDALDNDCDGVINDGLPNQNLSSDCTTTLPGICSAGTRHKYCDANVNSYNWSSCIKTVNPSFETCNGVDDDCDGTVDEDCACTIGTNQSCGTDVGECVAGIQKCFNGYWNTTCIGEVAPRTEVCDALDNDCDGVVNDGMPIQNVNSDCNTGLPGICSAGTRHKYCNSNVTVYTWSSCLQNTDSSTEICNTLDDDCDGVVDEGCTCTNGITRSCGTDVGECVAGTQTCVSGSWGTACNGEVAPGTEICDGKDNNCNGIVDEDVCAAPSGGNSGTNTNTGNNNANNNANTGNNNANNNVNNGNNNPNVESPADITPNDNLNKTIPPVIEDVKTFSKANRLLIILAIIIMIGGIVSFVLFEHYESKKEEIVPTKVSMNTSTNTQVQQPSLGKVNNYGVNGAVNSYGTNTFRSNNYGTSNTTGAVNNLVNQDAPAMNYVFAMRQKGFKDDVIMNNLRSRGWSEDLLRRLFK